MNDRYTKHLADMKARHVQDLDLLKGALAGRRPGLLRALMKNYRTIEAETARIFELIDRREGSYEGNEKRA
jgi:hypothetical protein